MASPRLRDRSRLRSTHKAKHLHQYEVPRKKDPDHELIRVSPSPAMHLPRKDYQSMIDEGRGVAFAHLDRSVEEEAETLFAGMSSAAACIVLELPRQPAATPRELPWKGSNKRGRTKQTNVPSIKDVHSWRDAMSGDSHRFKPVYTHRFFVGERIKGYRPTERAEEEVMEVLPVGVGVHESFSYHVSARYELSVQVRLAPSCRKSAVILTVGKVGQPPASIVSHMNQVRQALALSELESRPEVVSEDDYEHNTATSKKRSRCSNTGLPQRKSRCVKAIQTSASAGKRRSSRKRVQIQVSSDESEDDASRSSFGLQALAPIATRRSGRRCSQTVIQSKRSLFSINESEESLSHSSDEHSGLDNNNKHSSRQLNNQFPRCETPTLTRSMSSQSSDSMFSCTSTGDIKLDGGKMRVETIVKHLMRGLPSVEGVLLFDGDDYSVVGEDVGSKSLYATVKSIDDVESDFLDKPVGTLVREYYKNKRVMSLQGSGGITPFSPEIDSSDDVPFALSLADMRTDNKARQYHDEIEKLAPWWIETADCVHMGLTEAISETEGHWKVLYLFEKHDTKQPSSKRGRGGRPNLQKASSKSSSAKYSLAGYMTLWFHGKNMVVCQVLILPPYQRSGHGTELLKTAYDLACAKCGPDTMDAVSQIDVELPGKAFVALRNRLDYDLFSEVIKRSHTPYSLIPSEYAKPIDLSSPPDQYITSLPDDIVSKVASKLRITCRQVQVAYEIWLLGEIDKRITDLVASTTNSNSSKQIVSLEACYESIVRRSLLRGMREKINEKFHSLTIDEQKLSLESSFKTRIALYRSILG